MEVQPRSDVFVVVTQPGEGQRPPAGFDGIWIDIIPGVEYRYTHVSGAGMSEQRETRLNGHLFAVEEDFIVLGPERFGPLPNGSHVEISNEGVFADGQLLGPLPERLPLPADGK